MQEIKVHPTETPWLVALEFKFDPVLKDQIKSIPGSAWDPKSKRWLCPLEMVPVLQARKDIRVVGVSNKPITPQLGRTPNIDDRLHPYQRVAVERAIRNGGRWIFNDEMGLGKTPQCIATLRVRGCRRVLIVCPAVVRQNWVRELKVWWSEYKGKVGSITSGRARKLGKKATKEREEAYGSDTQIVSYALVGEVDLRGWDAIVFDEIHRLKDSESKQSRACKSLAEQNPTATILGATATLFPNRPQDCWNVVNTIWPERFGRNFYSFLFRYTNATQGEYGWTFDGLNPLRGEELQARLQSLSSRTTKLDVPHLVPPFDVKYLRVRLDRTQASLGIQDQLAFLGQEKLKPVTDWVEDALVSTSHIAVLTHLKETAHRCATILGTKTNRPIFHIDGDLAPDERHWTLLRAKNSPGAIIVATMHSVGIGIDLTFCTQTIFAELYYRPETIIQALGRFSRLSGKVASSCTIMIALGTVEEVIATKLHEKISVINNAIKAGQTEGNLEHLIGEPKSEEEQLKELAIALATYTEEDDYGL